MPDQRRRSRPDAGTAVARRRPCRAGDRGAGWIVDAVVAAAIALATSDGLDAVTMRRAGGGPRRRRDDALHLRPRQGRTARPHARHRYAADAPGRTPPGSRGVERADRGRRRRTARCTCPSVGGDGLHPAATARPRADGKVRARARAPSTGSGSTDVEMDDALTYLLGFVQANARGRERRPSDAEDQPHERRAVVGDQRAAARPGLDRPPTHSPLAWAPRLVPLMAAPTTRTTRTASAFLVFSTASPHSSTTLHDARGVDRLGASASQPSSADSWGELLHVTGRSMRPTVARGLARVGVSAGSPRRRRQPCLGDNDSDSRVCPIRTYRRGMSNEPEPMPVAGRVASMNRRTLTAKVVHRRGECAARRPDRGLQCARRVVGGSSMSGAVTAQPGDTPEPTAAAGSECCWPLLPGGRELLQRRQDGPAGRQHRGFGRDDLFGGRGRRVPDRGRGPVPGQLRRDGRTQRPRAERRGTSRDRRRLPAVEPTTPCCSAAASGTCDRP